MSASSSPTTLSFARTPRQLRMRSQRIVHVVQTEKDTCDTVSVSVVTISEDGQAEETHETLDFCNLGVEDKEELAIETAVDDGTESDEDVADNSILFDVDLDDTSGPQLTPCECENHRRVTHARSVSLFSNDEFEPIRMTLPKRRPEPLRLTSHEIEQVEVPGSASSSPSSVASSGPSSSGSSGPSPGLNKPPMPYAQALMAGTSSSSSTFFSASSAASSTTYAGSTSYTKSDARVFCKYEKDGSSSPKVVDAVTPDNVTGTRGLVDLRVYGYEFSWSRLNGRSEAAHGLRPEDAAELEVFLKKGPHAFQPHSTPKSNSPKKSAFERKLFEVLKLLK